MKILGDDISIVSSFDGFYGHLTSSIESATLSDSSESLSIPSWVARDKLDEYVRSRSF